MSYGMFVASGVLLVLGALSVLFSRFFFRQPPKNGTESLDDLGAGCFYYVVAIAMFFGGSLLGLIGIIARLTGH